MHAFVNQCIDVRRRRKKEIEEARQDCIMQSRKVFRERTNATSRRIKVRFLIHTYTGRRASNNNSNSRDTCIAFQGYFITAISLFFYVKTINSAFVALFHSDFICAVEWFCKKGWGRVYNQRYEKSILEENNKSANVCEIMNHMYRIIKIELNKYWIAITDKSRYPDFFP